ncbi:hypothetical protein GCM10029976_035800 [Kribbella albertanoniae]
MASGVNVGSAAAVRAEVATSATAAAAIAVARAVRVKRIRGIPFLTSVFATLVWSRCRFAVTSLIHRAGVASRSLFG